ncbi:MAG TPA: GTP 3',8-cyclase MoaA [Acidimicrobiales bacterium]|nr:GTP 3',8-cyclase MoaA [Acidimicrobiales bacterium]
MAQPTPSQPLVDPFDRVVRDLRISVTDRCNFRCTYCMPEEGMRWLPRDQLLTFEEIVRVARVCVDRFGFDGIRITGGEPTVRAQLPVLIEKLAALRVPATGEPVDLAMTTNGVSLALLADDLRRAGLRRLNVSCDSLRADRFEAMTRRPQLDRVLAGIDAALAAGFDPVKVNVVTMRGVNDDEVVDFAAFGRARGVQPRFIEFMPLDAEGAWSRDKVVPSDEVVAAIDAVFPVEAVPGLGGGPEPAALYRYRDGKGAFGVIASVTHPFCGNCDRIRITAEGQLRNCLFALGETDLRAVLRQGGGDDQVAEAIRGNVATKWAGHSIGRVDFVRPSRSMSQIGG